MQLVVQTNIPGRLHVWLVQRDGEVHHYERQVEWHGSDQALALIDQALIRQRSTSQAITRCIVVRGPGPFTAVRTGLIIANTISWLKKIPAIGVTSSTLLTATEIRRLAAKPLASQRRLIKPVYGREPNITTPKPRKRR